MGRREALALDLGFFAAAASLKSQRCFFLSFPLLGVISIQSISIGCFWAGGKRRIAPAVAEVWKLGSYKRLIEPFAGSAAVFFEINPKQASLVELCAPLAEFYMALRQFRKLVVEAWDEVLATYSNSDTNYYAVRRKFNSLKLVDEDSAAKRAAYFLYLNKTCYHGLWRVNAAGQMNTPYGHYVTPTFPVAGDIIRAAQRLDKARVYNADFAAGFMGVRETDFLFCDPPYFDSYDGYTRQKFSLDHQRRLADHAKAALDAGAMVIVASRDCPVMRRLYPLKFWDRVKLGVLQRIAPQNGNKKPEILFVGRV